jgi:hypothetical protein
MNDKQRIQQFLENQKFMVVAVVLDDGSPWAVPVRIQRREGAEFEWDSKTSTVHSQALAANPLASITIFEKQPTTQFGFYAKGQVSVVDTRDDGYARYRFTAEQSWINDESFVKQEVSLS